MGVGVDEGGDDECVGPFELEGETCCGVGGDLLGGSDGEEVAMKGGERLIGDGRGELEQERAGLAEQACGVGDGGGFDPEKGMGRSTHGED